MNELGGLTAVVTGAASGIGRALAARAAREGMNVAIADVNKVALDSLAEELSALGVQVLVRVLDVSDAHAMNDFATECFGRFKTVDLLFNNAGILRVGCSWEQGAESWQRIISINLMGVVNGVNAFLPRIVEDGNAAHIVNTGSVGSLVAASGMAQYTACKMAVRGFTESLSLDLQMLQAPVGVSLLCPGPVSTHIADAVITANMGADADPAVLDEIRAATVSADPNFITPDVCADKVFDAIRRGQFWIFTHPFTGYYREQTDAILNGENPRYSEVHFD
jgi:short-subunit dehydrogenase